jgi:hypothetical protein
LGQYLTVSRARPLVNEPLLPTTVDLNRR